MGVRSNKARKYGKERGLVYNTKVIDNMLNIMLILSLMGIMFTYGLCFGNQCAYIEERNPFTQEIISPKPINFSLANTTQSISMWFVVAYVGLSIWNYKLKRGKYE